MPTVHYFLTGFLGWDLRGQCPFLSASAPHRHLASWPSNTCPQPVSAHHLLAGFLKIICSLLAVKKFMLIVENLLVENENITKINGRASPPAQSSILRSSKDWDWAV